MNLARVEYYLSDFLSIIETRHREDGRVVTDEIILDKAASVTYGKVILLLVSRCRYMLKQKIVNIKNQQRRSAI